MISNSPITLFEYESLPYSDSRLSSNSNHLDLIDQLNQSNGELLTLHRNGLQAKQYVGLIQVRDLSIEILPKMYRDGLTEAAQVEHAQRNLLYLLHYCYDIPIYESEIAHMQSRKANWFEILTFMFTRTLQDIFKKGAQKQYISVEENLPYFKGKCLIQKHIAVNSFKKHLFYVNYDEFSPDIQLNQVLKFVVNKLKLRSQDLENRRNLHILDQEMDDISLVSNPAPLLDKVIFTRLNENYRPVFNLAKMFIEGNVVETSVGSTGAFAFTFDMNLLFERFIARFLKEHRESILPDHLQNCGIYSQAGGKELARNSKDGKVFWLRPDILIEEKGQAQLIIDTKYKKLKKEDRKLGISISDMYQMAAYASRYCCSNIILLYPRTAGGNEAILEEYTLQGTGHKVRIATVDLRVDLTNPVNKMKLINDLKGILGEV
ncbi:MAG: 5-methylcytosine-specific restriction enzyme subunit McrC [Methanolobus sp.]|jgi:5-methylcytosine-specific restriction enzyme subunit McrC|nr:5-methylcytosine-specific restriction enzyme subunit McrC [Methanolobus sp.]